MELALSAAHDDEVVLVCFLMPIYGATKSNQNMGQLCYNVLMHMLNGTTSGIQRFKRQQTLQDRFSRLVPATSWAATHVLITDEGSAIAAAIREGRCVSMSDVSFKDQYGNAAWAIETEPHPRIIGARE
jgi:hypothetical protein